jgi:beta-galactosidase
VEKFGKGERLDNDWNIGPILPQEVNKPLIMCEYAHAMGNAGGGFKTYTDLFRMYPERLQGGFLWDFVDQSIRITKNGVSYYGYGGDYNSYDVSGDQNFCGNGLINPDRKYNPHAYEVKRMYQSLWITPVDMTEGLVTIKNENFFRNTDNYYAQWQLLVDGEAVQTGVIPDLNVNPQQSAQISINYDLTGIDMNKELLLNVECCLKEAETLLPVGYAVAKNQLTIHPYQTPDLSSFNNKQGITAPVLNENDNQFIIVEGANFQINFGRTDGFLSLYNVNGKTMLKDGGKLTPNFWRAPTDNDWGDHQTMIAWKNPNLELVNLESNVENDQVIVHAEYEIQSVSAVLSLDYTINNEGAVKVTQKMTADKSAQNIPNLFRFGMQLQMPYNMDSIEYYGRGPIENYIDRNSGYDLGIYKQTVDEQFYAYIRPQENGTKTDIRHWTLSNEEGDGLRFVADAPFSASALHYSIESLDDGLDKHNRHSELVEKADYTNFCIDKKQMGVRCNPQGYAGDKYEAPFLVPYGDYEFSFVMYPLNRNNTTSFRQTVISNF